MTDSRVALGMDRLPWLPDEPAKASRQAGGLLRWVLAAILVVAGASYWLGSRTGVDDIVVRPQAQPSATVPLPDARRVEPQRVEPLQAPEVSPVPPPEVRPVTSPPAKVSSSPGFRLPRTMPKGLPERVKRTLATDELNRVAEKQKSTSAKTETVKPKAPPLANTQRVKLWPARYSTGATGRVVQIGAFGSRIQAKRGWKHMSQAYPGVRRLPAVVVETRNSRGRPFYRFQIGTTSQAHSEVLCQRMQRIRFSCAVVGLPGERKAVER